MEIKDLVRTWFRKWETGDFQNIPISENFRHTSPFGTIEGKKEYLKLVEANKDKFLGHRFVIHDEIYGQDKACVRYTAIHGDTSYEVSEWYFPERGLIGEIIAHFNIATEIPANRKLTTS
ncbi:MAG TPA: nuclear transport factor 2 family protein [Eudoraea sp.]|nr:nuclear transport factor 2 family protein [Eudoraea sp.]